MDNVPEAIIVPQPGKEKETIRLLLELAAHRRDVRTNTDGPGLTLIVPESLHQRYLQSGQSDVTGVKRRGRPPGRPSAKATVDVEANDKDGED